MVAGDPRERGCGIREEGFGDSAQLARSRHARRCEIDDRLVESLQQRGCRDAVAMEETQAPGEEREEQSSPCGGERNSEGMCRPGCRIRVVRAYGQDAATLRPADRCALVAGEPQRFTGEEREVRRGGRNVRASGYGPHHDGYTCVEHGSRRTGRKGVEIEGEEGGQESADLGSSRRVRQP
jgi:hypothetical protein